MNLEKFMKGDAKVHIMTGIWSLKGNDIDELLILLCMATRLPKSSSSKGAPMR